MIRRGSMLVIAAGLAAIVASLGLAFLVRAGQDAEEGRQVSRLMQARLMLAAGLQYIQETSRVGWDLSASTTPRWQDVASISDPDNRIHEEAFGWVDVRDGQIGPKTLDYNGDGAYDRRYDDTLVERTRPGIAPDRPAWPAIGGVCRAPMEVLERPPWSIEPVVTPNPIDNEPKPDPSYFGLPLLRNHDPLPAGIYWDAHRDGVAIVRGESRNLGWFRVYRDGPATFVITAGSGATQGFRDADEVVAAGLGRLFGVESNDPVELADIFADLLASEVRLWYRVEWSAAVPVDAPVGARVGDAVHWQQNANVGGWGGTPKFQSVARNRNNVAPWSMPRNQGGTIAFVQRLQYPPDKW